MCHNNFNMWCKALIVVIDIQLIAPSPFPCQLPCPCLTEESSLLKWVTLLYCFATNQGHCMLIKFTVDGLNRINAQAHNQRYSLNIFKWPYCEDDFILLSNTARQEGSLAVEPVSLCFPVITGTPLLQCGSALLWERDCEGTPSDKGKAFLPFSSPFLISGPDESPLLLAERHVCPTLPTAEICLWCKHPCLSPWQPSLLPAVGCHASRLPHALPHPLALYCRWHVRALYIALRDPSSYLHKLLSLCCLSLLLLEVVPFLAAAQKPCIVLHPQLQECFHSRELPTSAARVNCWNNGTTSKSPQLKRWRYITASSLSFYSSCSL